MNKIRKLSFLTVAAMICAVFISVFTYETDVQAATSGKIPCSQGEVTWTLDNGVLTFSGNGTTKTLSNRNNNWWFYWDDECFDRTAVTSVKVAAGSKIKLETCSSMFEDFSNCTTIDLSGFDTGNVTDMSWMFRNCKSLTKIDLSDVDTGKVTDMSYMFFNCGAMEIDLSGFDTGNVTDMSYMFFNCGVMEIDLSGFDTGKVTNMRSMFYDCGAMEIDVSGFNTGNVTNMSGMFMGCEATKLDLSGFDTRNVTDMGSMFNGCKSTKLDLTNFNTANVTNMGYMFRNCEATEIDLSRFNTDKVTDMDGMFEYCKATELDLSSFNTANVTDMRYMFEGCELLTKLNLANINTGKVTDMESMFYNCKLLTEIDLSSFDTSNVTNMRGMFRNCQSLTELDVSGFDTSKVTDMGYMFYYCGAMEIDASGFNTENVTNMEGMFYSCRAMEIDVSGFNTGNVTNMSGMFKNCVLLTELNTSNFDTGKVTNTEDFIDNCRSLNKITTPKTKTTITLPDLAADKYWVDTDKKIYSVAEYTFDKSTEIHRVNGSYNINYVSDGELIDCPTTYKVTEGIAVLGTARANCKKLEGWYLDSEYTQPISSIEKGTFGNLTLYGKLAANHDIDRANGTVIKAATEKEAGTIQYKCKNCTYTITEEIPKLPSSEDEKSQIPEEQPQEQPEAPSDPTESNIINNENEKDVKDSSFAKIQARITKTTKNTITLKWNKVKGADGYLIYGTKCGIKNKYKLIKTIKNNKKTTFTQKRLKKGTYYRYIVRAYKTVEGKNVNVAISKTVHATTTGGKYGNAKSVKVNKTSITLAQNKTFKLKASEVKQSKKIDLHRTVLFESSDTSIATVSKKGVVKGKKKGTCYIYAYAQNGVYKKIKVKVK